MLCLNKILKTVNHTKTFEVINQKMICFIYINENCIAIDLLDGVVSSNEKFNDLIVEKIKFCFEKYYLNYKIISPREIHLLFKDAALKIKK